MRQYLELLQNIVDHGVLVPDRTGVGRYRLIGYTLRFNLQEGFPLVTTKKLNYKAAFKEMLWFIKGGSNTKDLEVEDIKIWDRWAVRKEDIIAFMALYHNDITGYDRAALEQEYTQMFLGSIGPIYGPSWRLADGGKHHSRNTNRKLSDIASDKIEYLKQLYKNYKDEREEYNQHLIDASKPPLEPPDTFEQFAVHNSYMYVDQLQEVIRGLVERPYSSRHVINAWIPSNIPDERIPPQHNVLFGKGALAPCHVMQQYIVLPGETMPYLSLKLDMRSADVPIGLPFNIAQYALLLSLVARATDMIPFELIITIGDAHIYTDQLQLVHTQLAREPYQLPKLILDRNIKDIYKVNLFDIAIKGYWCHERIKYPVAV